MKTQNVVEEPEGETRIRASGDSTGRSVADKAISSPTISVVKTSVEAKTSSKPLNFLRYVASKLKPTNWRRKTKEERMVAKSEYLIER